MYKKARSHWKSKDPRFYEMSLMHTIKDIETSKDLFRDICSTIIGQQLSGKAAGTIFSRFKVLFPNGKMGKISATYVAKISDESMRGAGLSGAKTRAIRDLSERVISGKLDLINLPKLSDVEVIEKIVTVKGIGPWTAEMILMFSLGRTDIFSMGDLVLKKELMKWYGWKKLPSDKKVAEAISLWSPYKTYAAKVLWSRADSVKSKKLEK